MVNYKRKDWLKEALLISFVAHLLGFILFSFVKIPAPEQIFYVTMQPSEASEPLVEKQPIPTRPVVPVVEEEEIELDRLENTLEAEPVEPAIESVENPSRPASPRPVIPPRPTPPATQNPPSTPPSRPNPPTTNPPATPPTRPTPPVTPPVQNPPRPTAPVQNPPIPTPPPVTQDPSAPTIPITPPTPTNPPVTENPPAQEPESTSPPATEEPSPPANSSEEGSSSSLGEEWRFLEQGSASEGQSGEAVGRALYTLQSASRTVVKEPDFSFLKQSTFYTKSAFIRVRLSILADGSVLQATLLDSGSGDKELDRLILASLLDMMFNDISAQRNTTQIGTLTIRFA